MANYKFTFTFLLLLILGILSIGIRVWWGVKTEWEMAEESLKKGDYAEAIIHYEKVILWKYPFCDFANKAISEIERLSKDKNAIVRAYARDALSFSSAFVNQQKEKGSEYLPDPIWSLIMGFSLLGWIVSIFFLIWFGFSRNLKLQNKPLFFLSFVIISFFVCLWVYSILKL